MKIVIYILSLLFLLLSISSNAQVQNIRIDDSYNYLSWDDFAIKLKNDKKISMYYNKNDVNLKIQDIKGKQNLIKFLSELLLPHKLYVVTYPPNNIFITKEAPLDYSYVDDFFTKETKKIEEKQLRKIKDNYIKTRNSYLNSIKTIGIGPVIDANKKVQLTGTVYYTKGNAIPITGATVYIEELKTGTATNLNGEFDIYIKPGKYKLKVSSIDCKEEVHQLDILSGGNINLYLETKSHNLDEVLIVGNAIDNIRGEQMGIERLTTKKIEEIPLILGEKDIVKIAMLLPGVQSVGEGSSGFNVRGSPVDHNLFYINHVPVYNTSHLFGFFSAFNSEAISEFSLMKSNIPAKYGGRLASIFDIKAKKGGDKFALRGGISPITGNIMVSGPIKGKSNFMISARSTYSNWLLKLVKNPQINNSHFQFGDFITNFSFVLGPKDNINFFTYYSYDTVNYNDLSKFKYNNLGASTTWHHHIKENRDLNLSLVYSNYGFNIENREFRLSSYKQRTSTTHLESKLNFDFKILDTHELDFGINSILYKLDRGNHEPLLIGKKTDPIVLGKEKSLETGIYIGDRWKINDKLSINGGLRYNLYNFLGPNNILIYDSSGNKTNRTVIDTIHYKNNEIISTSNGLDFRFGAKYIINDNMSIKASIDRLHQYIFMLSNTIALSPNDKWKLSDNYLKPLVGDQFSLGLYTNLFEDKLETYIETYYKNVKNLVENKNGADLVINPYPEQNAVSGKLNSYGIEFMIKKPRGKFNGWINYTYSKATVTANDATSPINFGIPYPANYDKPHAINLVANYKIGRRISLSSNVVYNTGRPATFPTTLYFQNGVLIHHFSNRNEFKIPDYFRVDLSLKLEGNLSAKKVFHGTWFFSVYNITGRHNTYSVYFTTGNNQILGRKISIFAQPIISISYNIKLGNYAD